MGTSTNAILAVNQASLARLMQSEEAARSLLAALAFLVWDLLITFDDEILHIWTNKFQPLKLLYLITRYYPAISLIILNTRSLHCQQWIIIEAISAVILEIAVEIILIMRIYAMYTASRRLLQFLIPIFVAQLVIVTISLSISLPKLMASPNCEETVFPVEIIAYSITSIIFEAFLFGLTLYKYYTARAEGWGGGMLLIILVRDGMWAFLLVFVANVANTLFFTIAPATLAALGLPWLLAILGSVGPRLVLNIRRASAKQRAYDPDDVTFPLISYTSVDVEDKGPEEYIQKPSKQMSLPAPHLGSWTSRFSWKRSHGSRAVATWS